MNYTLTTTEIKNAKPLPDGKARKLWDGGGLHLYVSPTNAKLWRYKFRLHNKEHLFSIGAFPEVGLADARAKHAKARLLVQQGVHPLAQREADKLQTGFDIGNTFKAVALEWIGKKEPHWSPYYSKQVRTFLASDVFPSIGDLPIKKVTSQLILAILKKAESRGAPTIANLIRQWCSNIFLYAIGNLKAEYDPTAVLKGAVIRPKVKHNVALAPSQITDLLKKLGKFTAYRTTGIAIELLLLTFVRTVEMRQATWGEFDFDKKEWRIPAKRMKRKVEHIVPLSNQAIALLKELQRITGSGHWMFPNHRRPALCMDKTTINQALKRLGFSGAGTIGFSAHGFRGTASTILYEKGYRSEAIEMQLSHSERNQVKAAYNKAQYLPERHLMMAQWSDYIDEIRPCVKGMKTTHPVQSTVQSAARLMQG